MTSELTLSNFRVIKSDQDRNIDCRPDNRDYYSRCQAVICIDREAAHKFLLAHSDTKGKRVLTTALTASPNTLAGATILVYPNNNNVALFGAATNNTYFDLARFKALMQLADIQIPAQLANLFDDYSRCGLYIFSLAGGHFYDTKYKAAVIVNSNPGDVVQALLYIGAAGFAATYSDLYPSEHPTAAFENFTSQCTVHRIVNGKIAWITDSIFDRESDNTWYKMVINAMRGAKNTALDGSKPETVNNRKDATRQQHLREMLGDLRESVAKIGAVLEQLSAIIDADED